MKETECKPNRLFNIYGEDRGTGFAGNVWDKEALSPALTTMDGGNREPLILDEQNGYIRQDGTVGTITTDGSSPKHNNRIIVTGNYSPSGHDASRIVDTEGLAPTVKENHGTVTAVEQQADFRIRKLTPRECWRLMDFDDEDFDKASKVNSDSQLYKQAGNSIVVNCLYLIFKELL